ncbi:MAG: hypothetical protein MUC97_15680 [Bernardetiaceae bacterium]|jgi:hypothetical protein|nr:hypothetical protein [Bernardetiaceae bacterium]
MKISFTPKTLWQCLTVLAICCLSSVPHQTSQGSMSAKFNGKAWSVNGKCSYELIRTTLIVTGASKDARNAMRLVVKNYNGPGQYTFNAADVTYDGNFYALSPNKTDNQGTLTVKQVGGKLMEGVFEFYCVPLAQNPGIAHQTVNDGKFKAVAK